MTSNLVRNENCRNSTKTSEKAEHFPPIPVPLEKSKQKEDLDNSIKDVHKDVPQSSLEAETKSFKISFQNTEVSTRPTNFVENHLVSKVRFGTDDKGERNISIMEKD